MTDTSFETKPVSEPRAGNLDDDIRRQAVSVIVSANARRRSRRGLDVVDVVTVQAAEEYVAALADRGLLRSDTLTTEGKN